MWAVAHRLAGEAAARAAWRTVLQAAAGLAASVIAGWPARQLAETGVKKSAVEHARLPAARLALMPAGKNARQLAGAIVIAPAALPARLTAAELARMPAEAVVRRVAEITVRGAAAMIVKRPVILSARPVLAARLVEKTVELAVMENAAEIVTLTAARSAQPLAE
ncbi:hypothetical protein NO1_1057 [Candidatus Termititenax aidoneus]|uniref:Uncharacterized protein n=1 Tax=Termititenax aidoneus TaxID=2218524 RepID=A0A388TAJ8_TERA1|nr:hypothetical protein NO1_1057 [Candidatus Termititenax aidoneus]